LCVALAACGGGGSGAPSLAERRHEVQFASRDGILLSGSLTSRRRRAPAVILVHQFGSDRHDWDGFVPALDRAGYTTLAYDIRGMGRSLSRFPSKERYQPPLDEERYAESMPRDVSAAVRFLRRQPEVDRRRIAVVGSSLGANVAYASKRRVAGLRTAVALSPVLLQDTLRPGRRGAQPRDVLFISSRGEAAAALSLLSKTAEPRRQVVARSSEGHGVGLLPDPSVRREILRWLRGHLR
jgi:pimeloyl-ACP methyl ester carboxylesterase